MRKEINSTKKNYSRRRFLTNEPSKSDMAGKCKSDDVDEADGFINSFCDFIFR